MNRLLLVLLLAASCSATEILSWGEGLEAMHAGKAEAYCVYIGRNKSQMLELIRSGKVNTNNVPVIHLSAADQVLNPYSGRTVPGRDMIVNLVGPVNDLTGGSFLFFDKNGVLLPQFTVIQNFHRDRPEVVELYCKMVVSPLRGKLSLAEFARFEGLPIGVQLTMEVEAGKHKDFSHIFREIPKDAIFPVAVDNEGRPRDPRKDAVITVITRDPNGEVFIAQVRELWEKLSIPNGTEFNRPPLLIVGPAKASYPALTAMGITFETAAYTEEQLNQLRTPMLILPGNEERGATQVMGFVPGQVIGTYILPKGHQSLINNYTILHPDIPIGDADVGANAP